MPVSWDDEPYASLNVMLVSPTGPTLPLNHVFGLGHANGIENDVALKRFTIESQSGVETDAQAASLIQGTFVTVHAYLGFEGVQDAVPRTGQAQVRLLVDGQDKVQPTSFSTVFLRLSTAFHRVPIISKWNLRSRPLLDKA